MTVCIFVCGHVCFCRVRAHGRHSSACVVVRVSRFARMASLVRACGHMHIYMHMAICKSRMRAAPAGRGGSLGVGRRLARVGRWQSQCANDPDVVVRDVPLRGIAHAVPPPTPRHPFGGTPETRPTSRENIQFFHIQKRRPPTSCKRAQPPAPQCRTGGKPGSRRPPASSRRALCRRQRAATRLRRRREGDTHHF